MKNLIVRTITGIIFVTAVVVCFLRPLAMIVLFGLVTGLTVWEFTGIINRGKGLSVNRFITTVAGVYFFLAMSGCCWGITPPTVFIPYLITIVYLLVAGLYSGSEDPLGDWAYTMMSQIYIALPFSLINVLAFSAGPYPGNYSFYIPLSVFIFLWISDTGAYCCGSLLGRHKLFPRISPAKSWEGTIGGILFAVASAWLIFSILEGEGIESHGMGLAELIGLGIVVSVFGTWGDLVESLLKRTLEIKDSGSILPGHGGMLDRFDSSLLAIPAAVVYLFTLSLL